MPVLIPPMGTASMIAAQAAANAAVTTTRITQMNSMLGMGGRMQAQSCSPVGFDGGDWRPYDTAPRDGTVVELRNSYGIAPWYGIFKWVEGRGWQDAQRDERGCGDGPHISWRPYEGEPSAYSDPTGGFQDTPAYWDMAVVRATGGLLNPAVERAKNARKERRIAAHEGPSDDVLIGLIAIVLALCILVPIMAVVL